jgi:hypothetical protein
MRAVICSTYTQTKAKPTNAQYRTWDGAFFVQSVPTALAIVSLFFRIHRIIVAEDICC